MTSGRNGAQLVRRVTSLVSRLAATARRHPSAVDGLLAALVLLALGPGVTTRAEIDGILGMPWRAIVEIAMVLPIVWRRRAPMAGLAAFGVVAGGQGLVGPPLGTEAAGLVLLYSVVASQRPRTALVTVAVVVLVGTGARLRWASEESVEQLVSEVGWILLLVTVAVALGLLRRTQRAYVVERAGRAEARAAARAHEAAAAAATERAHLARETHDVTAHGLVVMISLAEGAAVTAERDPETAAELMREIAATGRRSLADLRDLLGALEHGSAATAATTRPQPGLDDVDELLEPLRRAGLDATLERSGRARPLSAATQLTAYRVVQEAVTNVLKHSAGARAVNVRLTWVPQALDVEVADDGPAVDGRATAAPAPRRPVTTGRWPGRGLAGLRQRTAVHGARLDAGPGPDGGWCISTRLPAPEHQ